MQVEHQYALKQNFMKNHLSLNTQLDDWVFCVIYQTPKLLG